MMSAVVAVTTITEAEPYERRTEPIGIGIAVAIGRIAVRIIIVIITGTTVPVPILVAVIPAVSFAAVPAVHLLNEAFVQFGQGSICQSARERACHAWT